jgi:prevent-host-death family protein
MAVRTMNATEFKAKCLAVLDQVQGGTEVIVTKRGKPVARLVPVTPVRKTTRGMWKGKGRITGEIVHNDWSYLFDVLKDK